MTNAFEDILLEIGLGWTFAKFLPYFLLILLGIVIAWYLKKWKLLLWLKLIIISILSLSPVASYFFFFPIYQADLSNNSYKPAVTPKITEDEAFLAVVVLPGCPYCEGSVKTMNALIKKNPKLQIHYYLVSEDPISEANFKRKLNGKIKVIYNQDATLWLLASEGIFPSYLLFDKGKLKAAWHNTTFGVRSLDFLSSYK